MRLAVHSLVVLIALSLAATPAMSCCIAGHAAGAVAEPAHAAMGAPGRAGGHRAEHGDRLPGTATDDHPPAANDRDAAKPPCHRHGSGNGRGEAAGEPREAAAAAPAGDSTAAAPNADLSGSGAPCPEQCPGCDRAELDSSWLTSTSTVVLTGTRIDPPDVLWMALSPHPSRRNEALVHRHPPPPGDPPRPSLTPVQLGQILRL
jgi:hypothetical protein